jgi:hypothetical protein
MPDSDCVDSLIRYKIRECLIGTVFQSISSITVKDLI